ncbi:MAG: hypothetical protein FJ290_21620 [Planctomycetes bacterium]|nr:hypothetical protein [Planctomycetota bacterium]
MKIRGIACSMPSRRVSNEEVIELVRESSSARLSARQLDQVAARMRSLFRVSGSKYRHWREEGELARDFALRAAEEALEKAELSPGDIDLLLYVGVGRGWVEPGMSHYFTHALGLANATCFDLLDACLSWLRALHVAHQFLRSGVYRNIMVLNAEFHQAYDGWSISDPDELEYRFAQSTIGECATATILSKGEGGEEPYFEFRTDASLHTLCKIPLPNIAQYSEAERCPTLDPLVFFAYSADLFRAARRMIVAHYRGSHELRRRGYDIVFAHSASRSLADWIANEIGADGRSVNVFEEFGNTVSASIPAAMCWAIERGRLKRGMRMLHVMGSAGFSVGFAHMVY